MKKHTFLDLFGAPGGMSKGFELAGFTPLGMVDKFLDGVNTYRKNFPKVPEQNAVAHDASTPNFLKIFQKITGLKEGDVDVIIGGPPCQGFSTIGRVKIGSLVKNGTRTGRSKNPRFIDDPRNNLYKSFVKFVKFYKPKAVVMENVPGMVSYKDGAIAEQIVNDLKKIGYGNTDYNVLNAADYGVPQNRKRIIFIGTKKNTEILWPKPTSDENKITVGDAFADIPKLSLPERGAKLKEGIVNYKKLSDNSISDYLKFVRKDSPLLHNHITRWHRDKDIQVFQSMEQGMKWKDLSNENRKLIGYGDGQAKCSFNDKWKRLSTEQPSWTVVSHLQKDGYMYIHPTEDRTISVREAARLQSFPDRFVFYGSRSSQFKQIGNAVPPLFAKAIAKSVKKILS